MKFVLPLLEDFLIKRDLTMLRVLRQLTKVLR